MPDMWSERSIRMLLNMCYASPANIVIRIKKNETAYNPAGSDTVGPAQISYTMINDEVTSIVTDLTKKKVKK